MGCTTSKLDNEDTVRRCKERRRLMKASVYARHHLAAAHFDYCRSLRLTGAALSAFGAGEPLSVYDDAPAVLLHTPSSSSATTTAAFKPPPPPSRTHSIPSPSPSPAPSIYQPPPPAAAVASSNQQLRRKKPIKLPHILSDSSFTSSPKPTPLDYTYNAKANSTFSTTASQTSSVWNWENFYPPSPPDSEFFDQLKNKNNRIPNAASRSNYDEDEEDDKRSRYSAYSRKAESHHNQPQNTGGFDFFEDDKVSNYSSHSNYSSRSNKNNHWKQSATGKNVDNSHHLNRWDSGEEDGETEREEVQCSEWGDHDHYSTTSSSSDEEEELRSEIGSRSNFGSKREGFDAGSGIANAKNAGGKAGFGNSSNSSFHKSPANFPGKLEKLSSFDDGRSTSSWGNNGKGDREMVSDTRIVVRHKDLAEIVGAIQEYFDKAASAGDQVSEMLETGRAQLDQSFSKLKKTVYHSSGVLSNLSSSWTSKPPLAVKYKFEPGSLEVSGGPKSLCSSLDRLMAWENKLYEEVKAREGVKIENEKKLATLQSQEYKGEEEAKLDKTKASIKRLQSLIVVTSQAVSTTSSAIISQRDSELVPQLVELCHGFMYMWRSMNQFHQVQNDIVQQVRSLVNQASKGESTSDLHRQATRDLESAVSAWHSSFCRLIKFQRDFIRALHGWFKLSLVPINIEESNGSMQPSSDAFAFSDEWKLALDRVPDTVASEAIKSFINVVHSISMKQTEELKIKKRTESASKELEKKASSLRSIEKKYYNSYSLVGIGLPDTGPDNGHALDARDPLAEKKLELATCQRRVEDEMLKHSKAVEVTRAMTLNNIQTGLPGVFQAMTSFSALFTEALESVCTRSYAIK